MVQFAQKTLFTRELVLEHASQLLLAGEGFVSIAANVDSVEEYKAKGAPIDWLGLEPTISRLHPIALARTAQHPNAAKLYIDFILSKEAQEIITKEFIGISDRPDVKRVFTREGLKLHYADLSLAERYDNLYCTVGVHPDTESSEMPRSLKIAWPPVRTARSPMMALRRSP